MADPLYKVSNGTNNNLACEIGEIIFYNIIQNKTYDRLKSLYNSIQTAAHTCSLLTSHTHTHMLPVYSVNQFIPKQFEL